MITLLLLVRDTYMYGVFFHAHTVRGESHIQRNTTGEVVTHVRILVKSSYLSLFYNLVMKLPVNFSTCDKIRS